MSYYLNMYKLNRDDLRVKLIYALCNEQRKQGVRIGSPFIISYTDLSFRVHVSPYFVRNMMQELEKNGVITVRQSRTKKSRIVFNMYSLEVYLRSLERPAKTGYKSYEFKDYECKGSSSNIKIIHGSSYCGVLPS